MSPDAVDVLVKFVWVRLLEFLRALERKELKSGILVIFEDTDVVDWWE